VDQEAEEHSVRQPVKDHHHVFVVSVAAWAEMLLKAVVQ